MSYGEKSAAFILQEGVAREGSLGHELESLNIGGGGM
jgi:hypothetical protein